MPMPLRMLWALALLLAIGSDPIVTLLPPDGTPPGWQRKGQERLFAGAALYQHINGGAELYNQFGFELLAVQDYAQDARDVRVEIYRMNSTAGAGAVFAELTRGLATQTRFGAICTLDDYQILFQRDAYCIAVTCYEPGREAASALVAIAASIDSAIIARRR